MTVIYSSNRLVNTGTQTIPTALTVGHFEVKYISQNGLVDVAPIAGVDYVPSTVFLNYQSHIYDQAVPVYNPYAGQFGEVVYVGMGGHSGYDGNEAYRFLLGDPNLGSQYNRFVRLTNPYPSDETNHPSTFYANASIAGTYDVLPSGLDGPTSTGEWNFQSGGWYGHSTTTDHTRASSFAIPGGTGNQGRIVMPKWSNWLSATGVVGHVFDCHKIENPTSQQVADTTIPWWSRIGFTPVHTYSEATWYEPDTGLMGMMGRKAGAINSLWHLDTNTLTWGAAEALSSAINVNDDRCGAYADLCSNGTRRGLVLFLDSISGTNILHAVDVTGSPPYNHQVLANVQYTGGIPFQYCPGATPKYCPKDGNWYMLLDDYTNSGPRLAAPQFWKLTPPLDMRDASVTNTNLMVGQWTWTDVTNQLSQPIRDGTVNRSRVDGPIPSIGGWVYHSLWWVNSLSAFIFCNGWDNISSHTAYGPMHLIGI